MMSQVEIGTLFSNERCPRGIELAFLMLYFPIGIILAVLRLFIGFHAFLVACILPKLSSIRSIILRSMCGVIGIWVTQEGPENRDKSVKVMIANYTSTLDHLAVDLVMPNILPCVWDLPPTLMWLLGYSDMGVKQGRQALINNTKKHCLESDVPILVFPEGASTNGKAGLLKFSVWPFSLGMSVQPLVIKVSRPPFARVEPSVLGGRWWVDVFWFLFTPYTNFHIRTLPIVHKRDEESEEEFAGRVQQFIASKLGVSVTSHTSADKVEYAKRKLLESSMQNRNIAASNNNRPSSLWTSQPPASSHDAVSRMAEQVKDVLPHVPLSVIRQDLTLTKDIDLTITNILEGRVQFVPEEHGTTSSAASDVSPISSPKVSSSPVKGAVAAQSFSKNSKERHLSLAERKRILIDTARKKYMEKHGML